MSDNKNYKQDIKEFIVKLEEKYGQLPKFAHNLKKFDNKVLYSGFYWDSNELEAMLESLLFDVWSINGVKVAEFERKFSEKVGHKYSLMVNSGSSANLVMIAGLKKYFGWREGKDKIITSACCFPTTAAVIPQNGLIPIFVDVNFEDLNIDLDKIEEKIDKDVKAVFFAPTLGNPGHFQKLIDICEKHKIYLILDGCDCLGTTFNNKELNEYVIVSSCSFFASHHASCIQAGMVSSNNQELIRICRSLSTWSRRCECRGIANLLKDGTCKKRFSNWLKDTQPDIIIDDKYFFTERGWNLQALEFQGAIGLEQLKKFEEIHEKRRQNHDKIQELFRKYVSDLTFPKVYDKVNPSWFGVGIITKDYPQKLKLVQFLENNNIQTRNFFSGNILEHPGYKDLGNWREFPRASETLRRVFFIGCAPSYTDEHIKYIESVLKSYAQIP